MKLLQRLSSEIIDIIFPKICLSCGREGQYVCQNCETFFSEVNLIEVKLQSNIMSVWEYEGLMEKAIQKIKYDGCYDIIDELIEKVFQKIKLDLPEDAVITFVPMHRKREKRRGFNQAELIAKEIGKKTDRPVIKLLEKIKDNRSQVGLSPQERIENVKGVFNYLDCSKPNFEQFLLENVLIIDDVYTTGATMAECTKVLKKAGIKNIYGFTLARKLKI